MPYVEGLETYVVRGLNRKKSSFGAVAAYGRCLKSAPPDISDHHATYKRRCAWTKNWSEQLLLCYYRRGNECTPPHRRSYPAYFRPPDVLASAVPGALVEDAPACSLAWAVRISTKKWGEIRGREGGRGFGGERMCPATDTEKTGRGGGTRPPSLLAIGVWPHDGKQVRCTSTNCQHGLSQQCQVLCDALLTPQ